MSLDTVLVKQEPEWMDSEDSFNVDHVRVKEELLCEASCVDAYELYADHVVKDELVLGPECPHRPHVGLTSRWHIGKAEFDIEVKVEPLCLDSVTASLHEQVTKDKLALEPVEPNQDIQQPVRENIDSVHRLRDCFVRLERLTHTQAFCTDVPINNTDVATPQQRAASHTRTTGKREMKTTHHKDKNYECDTCSKIFELKSNLTKHIQQHMQKQKTNENSHTFKQHMCELCGQQFAQISHLNRHNRIHTDKKYSCKICKKSYTRLNNLRDHKLVHTRQKPYSCKTCKKQFNQRRSLRMHVRIHTGEKPYLCEVCNTGFARPSNFKRHMITHTGEMPYSCEICSKKFIRVSSLNEHTQVHTGKKHRCAVCERQFMRLATLKNHERKYHK